MDWSDEVVEKIARRLDPNAWHQEDRNREPSRKLARAILRIAETDLEEEDNN